MRPPPPKITSNNNSPCVRQCCLDDSDICLGCGRSLAEIIRWHDATEAERDVILAEALARREQRQKQFNAD